MGARTADSEANRFTHALGGASDFFHVYETTALIIELTFDDGLLGGAEDLDDVPLALFRCLTHYMEIPHLGTLHTVARVNGESSPFDVHLAFEGLDGPLVLRFADDSVMTFPVEELSRSSDRRPLPDPLTWDHACATGDAQAALEAVSLLMELAGITHRFEQDERIIAEAVQALFVALAKTQEPPRSLAREALIWLGRKVDRFVDEAVSTAGKAAGVGVVATIGLAADHLFPAVAHQIRDLIQMSER